MSLHNGKIINLASMAGKEPSACLNIKPINKNNELYKRNNAQRGRLKISSETKLPKESQRNMKVQSARDKIKAVQPTKNINKENQMNITRFYMIRM